MKKPSTDAEVALLTLLVAARGEFVGGRELEQHLGVSRVAVWQRVEKLQAQGVPIEAQRHHGYRLTGEPVEWHEGLLRAHAELVALPAALHFRPRIDSTNSEAQRLLLESAETPFLVLAGAQERGRGRWGREWHSPPAGNLYASYAFRPQLAPERMSTVTLWLGLALARCLREETGLQVMLKWPNDLWLDGRKLAGILTEARIDADRTRDLVFGVGLNCRRPAGGWPEALAAVAISLEEASGTDLAAHRLVARLSRVIVEAFADFEARDVRADLSAAWPAYDALAGRPISATQGNRELQGTAAGIDHEGCLLLRAADGSTHALRSGEVTLGSARHAD